MLPSQAVIDKLEAFLDEQMPVEHPDRFVIDSIDKADWAVRKIARYEANIAAAKALAEQRIKQINDWLAKECDENQKQIAFFESMLRPFAEQQIKTNDKKRSLKLPSGTFGFKKAQPAFSRDESQLLAWAKESAPSYVEVKETVKWGELKKTLCVHSVETQGEDGQPVTVLKALTADGEIVPGVTVEAMPDIFYVKAVE